MAANNRKDIAALIALEDEEEEDILQLLQTREDTSDLYKNRKEEGYYKLLIHKHLKSSDEKFREFFRLNKDQFQFVLTLVEADLQKPPTNAVKSPISPEEKLALTLRFFATGETYKSLSFAFRISYSYISLIIEDTVRVLCHRLQPIFLMPPDQAALRNKVVEFWDKWNFPNCVAAVDGKHIRMFCPRKSGSLFFNYKEYFSMVLLAMVDANCKFLYVDIGSYGKEGDSGIFQKSKMGKRVYSGKLFPPDQKLPESERILPYVVVADDAFRLHRHVLKPYTKPVARSDRRKSIFNYRLCRARRVTENAFALLCQVFRIFYTPIAVKPETCEHIIAATCCLHNLLRDAFLEKNARPVYEFNPAEAFPSEVIPLARSGGFANAAGFAVREQYTEFFNDEGIVHWQEERVFRTSSTRQ